MQFTLKRFREIYKKEKRFNKKRLNLFRQIILKGLTPVIVYQMGKVGSRSVERSIYNYDIQPLIHIHRLNPKNIKKVREEYLNANQKPTDERIGLWFYRNICLKNRKAKFITLVREPISRNFSAFFENYKRFTGFDYENSKLSAKELINVFLKQYMHDVPLSWFDDEINKTIGIDVYAQRFPKDIGYQRLCKGNFKLLVVKIEIPDHDKEKAIGDFLDIKNFQLQRVNIGEQKLYSNTYTKFKDEIRLPKVYLDRMLESKYTRHFYSESEIDQIYNFWNKKNKDELKKDI